MSRNDLPSTLTKCEDCGRILAQIQGHSCGADYGSGSRGREERQSLANADGRPSGTDVGVFHSGRSYHELTPSKDQVCRPDADTEIDKVWTREEAKQQGKSPCLTCLASEMDVAGGLKVDPGEACLVCAGEHCHRCQLLGIEPEGDIEAREKFSDHNLCDRCNRHLEGVLELSEETGNPASH